MIRVTITKYGKKEWTEKSNVLKRKTATDKIKPAREYDTPTALYDEEYEVVDVAKSATTEQLLLIQEVDDEAFELPRVIAAVNGLDVDARELYAVPAKALIAFDIIVQECRADGLFGKLPGLAEKFEALRNAMESPH